MVDNPNIDIRSILLSIIEEQQPQGPTDATLEASSVLNEADIRLKDAQISEREQAILTQWHELFRTGYLAWGKNLANPSHPFFHITKQGRDALANVSRDPSNPDGYLKVVYRDARLSPVAKSYLEEGLNCYVAALYKASAVMIGSASEAMILKLRDAVKIKLEKESKTIPTNLQSWKVKEVLTGLKGIFDKEKSKFEPALKDEYESYWSAFTQQIRAARNDAGHPASMERIKPETVHASLLIFPELAKLVNSLEKWFTEKQTKIGEEKK